MKSSTQRKTKPQKPKLEYLQQQLSKIVQLTNEQTEVAKYSLLKTKKSPSHISVKNEIVLSDGINQMRCGWLYKMFCCCFMNTKTYEIPKNTLSNRDLKREISKLQKLNVKPLLPKQSQRKKVLALDVDQTLLHSGFKLDSFDFITQVQKSGKPTNIMTKLRPGLEYFLSQMSKYYELIIFNSSVEYYSYQVVNKFDSKGLIKHRLFREHCIIINSLCLKNLKLLNRDLNQIVLLDNNKNSSLIQPQNILQISSFYDNEKDRELLKIIPFLKHLASQKQITNVSQQKDNYDNQIIHISERDENSYQPSMQTGDKLNSTGEGSSETYTDI